MRFPDINRRVIIIYIATLFLMFICSLFIYYANVLSKDTYYTGISIEGIPLKGLTQEEALEKVKEYAKNINLDKTISFSDGGTYYKYSMDDLGLSYLVDETVEETYAIGRKGSILSRLLQIRNVKKNNKNFTLMYKYNNESLNVILTKLQKKLYIQEKGAKLFYKDGKFTVLKETIGKNLNIDKSINIFEEFVSKRNFSSIPLFIEDIYPASTADNISNINSVITSSTTSFNASDVNRSFNIKYACQKLDGIVLMPGESFSMNTVLGPRTIENGYRDAKVIMHDELVDGPGGGVCQVTTTLYVVVLKSLLTVTERMHHSFPLAYVAPGQDATIADNYIDFKFTNSKDYPIAINAETYGGNLIIRMLGKKDQKFNVKLKSEIIETINPGPVEIIKDKSLYQGESFVVRDAKQGKRVQVTREVYDLNGVLIEKTKISDDIYRPIRGIIRVN